MGTGGSQRYAYDVNGDGLSDSEAQVVGGLLKAETARDSAMRVFDHTRKPQ